MKDKTLRELEKRIAQIKRELQNITEMRPGSLTCQYHNPKDKTGAYYQLSYTHKMKSRTDYCQYHNPKDKTGAYYQLSYTHKMKSRTDYIRSEFVPLIREQISEYKRFRVLVDEWVALAIQHSKMQMNKAKKCK